MLQSLRVKNLALIEETEVNFGPGLNILTGETGAGKSLLIGSLLLALGGKYDPTMLRKGAETGLVELTFSGEEPSVKECLRRLDIEPMEDDQVVITRKLQVGKSSCRINGETVNSRQLKELSQELIDIHGQHEHQSLLQKKKALEILDAFSGEELTLPLQKVKEHYQALKGLKEQFESSQKDTDALEKEKSLASFELQEIEAAALVPGEDEDLENAYTKMMHSQKIMEGMSQALGALSVDADGASSRISTALRAFHGITAYDETLREMEGQLLDIDSVLSDLCRDISSYIDDAEFSPEAFAYTENRLNTLNHLKDKYGNTLEKVLAYAQDCKDRLAWMEDYDASMEELQKKIDNESEHLLTACRELSKVRCKNAALLQEQLQKALLQLNFLTVDFAVSVTRKEEIGPGGFDEVEFLISTNPGEEKRPLGQVASGGELSRIMLGIKTVLAEKDAIDTLIFDEIDTGISGKTAWKVSGRLSQLSASHQVICITHLPQIAAMADHHFLIEKHGDEAGTSTKVSALSERGSLEELARLLGSDSLSEAALENARAMKEEAMKTKQLD